MYKIWKLYVKTYLSYRVRTKVLTKLSLWPWPLKNKMYRYLPLTILHQCTKFMKTTQVIVQSQSVDKVQLWPWPLTFWPQMYRYLPLTILHLCMKYENCMLKTTQVIMSEPKCWPSSLVTLTFYPKMHRYLPLTILHLCFLSLSCIYVWNMKDLRWKLLQLSCQNQSVDKIPLWQWPLTFWSQNVYVSSTHHPASMYEIWKLYVKNYANYRVGTKMLTDRRTKVIPIGRPPSDGSLNMKAVCWKLLKLGFVSVPKCWQISVVTLTIELLTPKCVGIFLLRSCIYVWNMKAVRWKRYNVRTKVLTKFRCDLDLWTPKCIGIFLSSKLYVENYSSYRVRTNVLTDRHTVGQTDKPDSNRALAYWAPLA